MQFEYDEIIRNHYNKVADEFGLSPLSTMGDEIVRKKETHIICKLVQALAEYQAKNSKQECDSEDFVVLDVGCGNGYTLSALALELPHCRFIGVEYNEKLRKLAGEQVSDLRNVDIKAGDIRSPNSEMAMADVAICQRVLINLMSHEDQKQVLHNIISMVKPNGHLIFIEAFCSGLDRLNSARKEFNLTLIEPAHHNLYLPDNFFTHADISPENRPGLEVPRNVFSTHYYVSRILHSAIVTQSGQTDFRNSHFVQFMSSALPDAIGDYAPLQVYCFRKFALAKHHDSEAEYFSKPPFSGQPHSPSQF